ncbi:MAG TPA: acyltransferase domain-containing protein, partial [Nannocystis sp.]
SLRSGECDMALAGGSSVTSPQATGYLYREGMITSRDGHCRAFDAEASGTVFGSGVGVVLLKRHRDALADGDTIYAVIRGSATNNDGASKLGYAAPSGEGQAAVVAEALAVAGVDAGTIGFVEAHGTATPFGDPIEVEALSQAFRSHTDRRQYCALGSVKTNVGHLQITSGIAGFIKAVLALYHRTIPPTLHFRVANPEIDLGNSPFFVNTEVAAWPEASDPPRASVHSLGIGGSNVHVVLEAAAQVTPGPAAEERTAHVCTLSARSEAALATRIEQLAAHVSAHPELPLADVCYSANAGRSHWRHRAAVVASTSEQLVARLAGLGAGESGPVGGPPSVAFLFSGQGCQYGGMARGLYATHPGFRADMDRSEEVFRKRTGQSLLAVMFADHDPRLHHTAFTQPALFAVEVALAGLWRSWGVEPAAMLGHSVGMYAAACTAGVLSLADGMALVTERARLMGALPEGGTMAAVFADPAEVRALLRDFAGRVHVAAVNAAQQVVISGETAAVAAVREVLDRKGVRSQPLHVSHAFHSHLMRPMLAEYRQVLSEVLWQPATIPLIADLTGAPADDTLAGPDYWQRHIVQPVLFHDGMLALRRAGCTVFVEIGPKPSLLALSEVTREPDTLAIASLRRDGDDWAVLLAGLARLYTRGVALDWQAFEAPYRRRRVPLPTYPFERHRHWLDPVEPGDVASGGGQPLLGRRITVASPERFFDATLTPSSHAYLWEHQVFGAAILPLAAHLELAWEAAEHTGTTADAALVIEDLAVHRPLLLGHTRCVVHAKLGPASDGPVPLEILLARDGRWESIATSRVSHQRVAAARLERPALARRCPAPGDPATLYADFADRGIDYGPI